MTSYLTSIDTFFLSPTFFEIFDFKVFWVWPWPSTFRRSPGVRNISHRLKAHTWLPILASIDTFFSISYRFRDIRLQKFSVFDLDLWTLEVTWGQKYSPSFESPYMTSYLTSIDTFFLSRTVFEIFDYKVFWVWPWPLTFRRSPGVKNIFTIWMPIHDFLS